MKSRFDGPLPPFGNDALPDTTGYQRQHQYRQQVRKPGREHVVYSRILVAGAKSRVLCGCGYRRFRALDYLPVPVSTDTRY